MFYKFSIDINFTKLVNDYGNFLPEEFASIWLSKVVLPDPKKPVSIVIGIFIEFYFGDYQILQVEKKFTLQTIFYFYRLGFNYFLLLT